MRETERATSEHDLILRHARLEAGDLAPPFESLGSPALFRHLGHGATGDEIIGIKLQQPARGQDCARNVAARDELGGLEREMLPAPAIVKTQAAEG